MIAHKDDFPRSSQLAETTYQPMSRLASLRPGQHAKVGGLQDSLPGFTRRRLLDLGLTPGTTITAENAGFFRDPVAYRVRGTLVALRRDDAQCVFIIVQSPQGRSP